MPINISRLADTALAGAVGFKHIKNQAESNLLSAEGSVNTATAQEAQVEKEKTDAEAEQFKFENENPNLSDEQVVNQQTIDNLNVQEQELSKSMFDKHPRNEKGQFISQMEHQQNVSNQLTEVNKDLEMARKARDVIENKLATRVQLGKAVDARKTQLEAAQANTQRANENLARVQKETNWVLGGKK